MVLMQQDPSTEHFYFIVAASTGLSPAQSRYSVYELETLAVQWALGKIGPYIFYGHPVMVLTDHKPLAGLEHKPLDPLMTNRDQRALQNILQYNLRIIHIPKTTNLLADFLSRRKHNSVEAPEVARHAPLPPTIAVISEGTPLDIKLVDLVAKAAEDMEYQDIIQALQQNNKPHQLPPQHPAQVYKQQWKHLSLFQLPNGFLILYLDLKPGDRLYVDYMVCNGVYYHIAVDATTDYLWAVETKAQSTSEALVHVDSIVNIMGRFAEVSSDNGPAYRGHFKRF